MDLRTYCQIDPTTGRVHSLVNVRRPDGLTPVLPTDPTCFEITTRPDKDVIVQSFMERVLNVAPADGKITGKPGLLADNLPSTDKDLATLNLNTQGLMEAANAVDL